MLYRAGIGRRRYAIEVSGKRHSYEVVTESGGVVHIFLSQFWLRLKGRRNKTAGFFVELIEMKLSILAGPSGHGLSPAQATKAARI